MVPVITMQHRNMHQSPPARHPLYTPGHSRTCNRQYPSPSKQATQQMLQCRSSTSSSIMCNHTRNSSLSNQQQLHRVAHPGIASRAVMWSK